MANNPQTHKSRTISKPCGGGITSEQPELCHPYVLSVQHVYIQNGMFNEQVIFNDRTKDISSPFDNDIFPDYRGNSLLPVIITLDSIFVWSLILILPLSNAAHNDTILTITICWSG
jgi:hypothetical protein